MATYVILAKFTDQAVREIKDTVKRSEAVRQAMSQAGGTIKEILWLQGQYDILAITEVPDETAATAFALSTMKKGYIRSETMRAFTAAEMGKILEKVT